MAIWTWWPGDRLPSLAPLPDFRVDLATEVEEIGFLTGLEPGEVEARLRAGNRCYAGSLAGSPVAFGWVANADASIGELDVSFQLERGNRYLWDFATLPAWRGRGVYPRLLQGILRNDRGPAHRYWIINAPENVASARGIAKAGFGVAGDLAFAEDGRAGIVPKGKADRGQVGAGLLGVPLIELTVDSRVSPCWSCVIDAARKGAQATCWPTGSLAATPCGCCSHGD